MEVDQSILVLYSSITACVVISMFILYKLLRPQFPCKVTCWFCHTQSKVPYGNRNCWDCWSCDQYNGFNKDGGYNKPIPSQYIEELNHSVTSPSQMSASESLFAESKLCSKCEQNQVLKIHQLANFTPSVEANFDAEVDAFKQRLEKAFRLCFSCEAKVNHELHRQDQILKPKVIKHRAERKRIMLESTELDSVTASNSYLSMLCNITKVILLLLVATQVMVNLCTVSSLTSAWSSPEHKYSKIHLLHKYVCDKMVNLTLTGLTLEISQVLLYFKLEKLRKLDLVICLTSLASYTQAVLSVHSLLPSLLVDYSILASVLSCSLFILHSIRLLPSEQANNRQNITIQRSDSPAVSDTHSLRSNYSIDSGLSGSCYTPAATSHSMSATSPAKDYDIDCTSEGLSSLNLGFGLNRSPKNSGSIYSAYSRPASISAAASLRAPSVSASVFSNHTSGSRHRSTYAASVIQPSIFSSNRSERKSPGSVSSFYTSRMTLNRSPGSVSTFRSPVSHLSPSYTSLYSGYSSPSTGVQSAPTIYQSASSSPNSASIYSHPYSSVSLQSRAPEHSSLMTQILLGVSLAINISIMAFLMGRYSSTGQIVII